MFEANGADETKFPEALQQQHGFGVCVCVYMTHNLLSPHIQATAGHFKVI